jgi:hypothetical protein
LITKYAGPAIPEITVEDFDGNQMLHHSSTFNFGAVAVGNTLERIFTIRNSGTGDPSGVGVSLSGENATFYSIESQPAATIGGGSFSTFRIAHAPTSAGTQGGVNLSIASNDADENPFQMTLVGTGAANRDGDLGSDDWETANGYDPDLAGDIEARDTDGDGVPDVLELLYGPDPDGGAVSSGAPRSSFDSSSQQMRAEFRRSMAQNAVVAVGQWSADLQNWYYSGESAAGVTVTFEEQVSNMGDCEIVLVTISVESGDPPRLFYRLNVQQVE